MESLADEFIISKSSLYNDLNAVSKQLGSNCLIISNDNGVYASGDELNIQKAIKQIVSFYTLTKIDGISGYEELLYILFDANIIELVHNILYGSYAELTENVSDYYIRSLEITMITLREFKWISMWKRKTISYSTIFAIWKHMWLPTA